MGLYLNRSQIRTANVKDIIGRRSERTSVSAQRARGHALAMVGIMVSNPSKLLTTKENEQFS